MLICIPHYRHISLTMRCTNVNIISTSEELCFKRKDNMKTTTGFTPGDENSQFYTKPDEAPVSHPAEVLERLKKEKPNTPMEDLVKEADEIVNQEMKDRQKQREEAAASTEATIEESNEEGEPEVSSK